MEYKNISMSKIDIFYININILYIKIYGFLLYLETFLTLLNKTKSYSLNESETVGSHNESGLIG